MGKVKITRDEQEFWVMLIYCIAESIRQEEMDTSGWDSASGREGPVMVFLHGMMRMFAAGRIEGFPGEPHMVDENRTVVARDVAARCTAAWGIDLDKFQEAYLFGKRVLERNGKNGLWHPGKPHKGNTSLN